MLPAQSDHTGTCRRGVRSLRTMTAPSDHTGTCWRGVRSLRTMTAPSDHTGTCWRGVRSLRPMTAPSDHAGTCWRGVRSLMPMTAKIKLYKKIYIKKEGALSSSTFSLVTHSVPCRLALDTPGKAGASHCQPRLTYSTFCLRRK